MNERKENKNEIEKKCVVSINLNQRVHILSFFALSQESLIKIQQTSANAFQARVHSKM